MFLGQVVVITMKATGWDAQPGSERMQFSQICIAHQVTPTPVTKVPDRVVDENAHDSLMATDARAQLAVATARRTAAAT